MKKRTFQNFDEQKTSRFAEERPMLSIKEQLTVLYVVAADFLDKHPKKCFGERYRFILGHSAQNVFLQVV